MAHKTHDLVVTVREYQDRDGTTKRETKNIGALMESDKGPFILLDRWFNPAGIPNPENRANLMVSCYEPRSREDNGNRQQSARQSSYDAQRPSGAPAGGAFDDEVPFNLEWRL